MTPNLFSANSKITETVLIRINQMGVPMWVSAYLSLHSGVWIVCGANGMYNLSHTIEVREWVPLPPKNSGVSNIHEVEDKTVALLRAFKSDSSLKPAIYSSKDSCWYYISYTNYSGLCASPYEWYPLPSVQDAFIYEKNEGVLL